MVTFFMAYLNVEIKAKCSNQKQIRDYLVSHKARFVGTDQQTDTYFNVPNGRLKLREGHIENNLIFYQRNDQPGPKSSGFDLIKVEDSKGLKIALEKACGIKLIVKKRRDIYFIENVKFHIDEVPGLGNFVEIEAGNLDVEKTQDELKKQCDFFMKEFGIKEEDLVAVSYSDLLAEKSILFNDYSS